MGFSVDLDLSVVCKVSRERWRKFWKQSSLTGEAKNIKEGGYAERETGLFRTEFGRVRMWFFGKFRTGLRGSPRRPEGSGKTIRRLLLRTAKPKKAERWYFFAPPVRSYRWLDLYQK